MRLAVIQTDTARVLRLGGVRGVRRFYWESQNPYEAIVPEHGVLWYVWLRTILDSHASSHLRDSRIPKDMNCLRTLRFHAHTHR